MQPSWFVICVVVVINTTWLLIQFSLQYIERNMGRIPGRNMYIPYTNKRFLYMQDFSTNGWGDLFGVVLLQVAFVHLWLNDKLERLHWITFAVVTLVAIVIFLRFCLGERHIPDSGFPDAKMISWSGIWHLPYLGINYAIASCDLILFMSMSEAMRWVATTGGVIYSIAFIRDIVTGRFSLLPEEENA